MQAVISASAAKSLGGNVAQVFIPTPEAKSSNIPYDQLYPKTFQSPQTYIRFSSTVEDCIGPAYCLDEEDDVFLLNVNHGRKDGEARLNEDLFEEVISYFESATEVLQPAAAVDAPPPPTLDELVAQYDHDDTPDLSLEGRKWVKEVYGHWQTRRIEKANRSMLPLLKYETGQDTDDADAYVCFRRREVRQARKTRGRDAQVAEKLKKMRRELEEARNLVQTVNQRERLKREHIEAERKVFEQRSELKRVKIAQGIKGEKGDDEDLLVNQRVRHIIFLIVKTRLTDSVQPAPKPKARGEGGARPTTLRINTTRSEGRAPENDLIQLLDIQEEAAAQARRFVEDKIRRHREWNNDWVDATWGPITPPPETSSMSGFLPELKEVQLPTPPASLRSESSDQQQKTKDVEMKDADGDADLPTPVSNGSREQSTAPLGTMFRFTSPPPEARNEDRPTYRRRYGRGGRIFVEERRTRPYVVSKGVVCDSDDESDDEAVVHPFNCHDVLGLSYRASLLGTRPKIELGRAQSSGDISMTNGQSTTGQGPGRPQ